MNKKFQPDHTFVCAKTMRLDLQYSHAHRVEDRSPSQSHIVESTCPASATMTLDNDRSPVLASRAGRAQFPHSVMFSSLLSDPASRPFLLQHERTTCCSRALLCRACVRCATVRNSCCAYATNRRSPQRLCLLFHLTLGALALARATRRSLVLRVVRSPARAARRSLVLRVRYVKHALPTTEHIFPHPLYLPSHSGTNTSTTPTTLSLSSSTLRALRFASPFVHPDSLSASLADAQVALSQLHTKLEGAQASSLASLSFLLFCARHPTVILLCRLSRRSLSHQSSCCAREQSLVVSPPLALWYRWLCLPHSFRCIVCNLRCMDP